MQLFEMHQWQEESKEIQKSVNNLLRDKLPELVEEDYDKWRRTAREIREENSKVYNPVPVSDGWASGIFASRRAGPSGRS